MTSINIKELDNTIHYDNILSRITIFDNIQQNNKCKKRKRIILNNNNKVLNINTINLQQFINTYYE